MDETRELERFLDAKLLVERYRYLKDIKRPRGENC